MLDFSDLPYEYFPPKHDPLIAWFVRVHNRWRYLPRFMRIESVRVSGLEAVRAARRRGDRVLLLPNHPTHADASIFLEAAHQGGFSPRFMAAYDIFLRSKRDAFVMQRIGAFSVDREGSDQRAMKQALAVLAEGRAALTVFPEGNVYLQNDRVTPFHDGAAFLAVRAAKACDGDGRVLVVPVSIKATFVEDARGALTRVLRETAAALGCEIDAAMTPLEALRLVGTEMLRRNLKQRGIAFETDADLPTLIDGAAGRVLEKLEAKLELTPKPRDTVMDRVRAARRLIHEVRSDPERVADHAAAATWADEAMLALRIASYSGRYVTESPTLDRIGETTEKLSEDLKRRMLPPIGRRRVRVRFNDPIIVDAAFLEGRKTRAAVGEISMGAEAAVQEGLDALNADNDAAGGRPWVEAVGAAT